MSDDEREHLTELHNLVGGGKKRRGCCCCVTHPICCSCTLGLVTAFCLTVVILGSVFQGRIDQAVQDAIGKHAALTKGSTATSEFIHSDAPLYTNYYLFNVTNAHDVMHKGAIPQLQQLGPYSYTENRTAYNLEWLEEDTKLRYSTAINYTWDPETSAGNPDKDMVVTINTPLIGVFTTVENMDSKMLDVVMEAIDYLKEKSGWDGLFVKHTVSELLWGYTDPLLAKLHEGHHLIHFIPDEDPVFSYAKISSVEEPNMVYTGVKNLSLVSRYIQWNNFTKMGWDNKYAAMINGTGGYSFHPGVTRDEILEIFIDELFRSGYFAYTCDILDHGITLYKFVLPDDELLNTTQEAGGFPGGNPNGVLNLTPVVPAHVPMFASKPHFLHADPGFLKNVTGLHPVAAIHDSYIAVEPITGAAMNAAKRIQVNLKLDRSSKFEEFESLRETTMLPIYYAEQTGAVTASLANQFKDTVFTIRYGVMGSLWAVVGLAGLISVICLMFLCGIWVQRYRDRHRRKERNVQYAGL